MFINLIFRYESNKICFAFKGVVKTGYIITKLKFIPVERFWNATAETQFPAEKDL